MSGENEGRDEGGEGEGGRGKRKGRARWRRLRDREGIVGTGAAQSTGKGRLSVHAVKNSINQGRESTRTSLNLSDCNPGGRMLIVHPVANRIIESSEIESRASLKLLQSETLCFDRSNKPGSRSGSR